MKKKTHTPHDQREFAKQHAKRVRALGKLPEYALRIMAMRRILHMEQKEFAAVVGVAQSAISSWERGKFQPSAESYAVLGNLAPLGGEAIWFWKQIGVDQDHLMQSAAMELVRGGVEFKGDIKPFTYLHEMEIGGQREVSIGTSDISVARAARILNIEADDVMRLTEQGELSARRVHPKGAPIISYDSIIDYLAKRRVPAKRKKK